MGGGGCCHLEVELCQVGRQLLPELRPGESRGTRSPGRAPVYAGQLRRLGNQHEVGEQTGEQAAKENYGSHCSCGFPAIIQ